MYLSFLPVFSWLDRACLTNILLSGCTVIYLKRLSMGSLQLKDLQKGEYRKLTEDEVLELQK